MVKTTHDCPMWVDVEIREVDACMRRNLLPQSNL